MNLIQLKLTFILSFLFIFLTSLSFAQKIKVACVGDSVTYGYGIENSEENSYPAQLQELLGEDYEVGNFGHSGATVLKNGHKPYWTKEAFKNSINFEPNIVIIHLGLNDQGNNNWPQHKNEFVDDYLDLINTYKSLKSKPKVLICRMSPTFSGHHWFEEGMRENFKEIQLKIEEISKNATVDLIDLHEPLYRFPEYFPDNLHPTKKGAAIIAQKSYSAITGNFGGLQLPKLYGEKMVLQRNEPIVINGISNFEDQITVTLHTTKLAASVAKDGKWKVLFPAMKAGGPFQLKIQSKIAKTILFKEVYVGEVWLASGQSNMDFKVKEMKSAPTVLLDSINPNIFLFSMDGNAHPSNHTFSKEELLNCNASNYFEYEGWSNEKTEILENFSAVAYSFAYNLQKKLNIPIGIICNAVGGSTTQSWISREQMESQHETVDLLNDMHFNPMVQNWTSERKSKNFENKIKLGIKARHPFDPTVLFDSGINPIKNYNIKGVIWYQGESNAERPNFHSKLFNLLVQDWRNHFKKPDMPFHFVQLSSINRPTWGEFRDSQRKLLAIPNTGMAVSSDVGHPTDVHPKKKWIVGERLAKIALAKQYNKKSAFSGPLLDFVNVNKNKLEVHFYYGEGLKSSTKNDIQDILIAGLDKKFVKASSKIIDDILYVWSKKIKHPRFVKYGYSPFTEGNLINKYNLPASTFSNLNN